MPAQGCTALRTREKEIAMSTAVRWARQAGAVHGRVKSNGEGQAGAALVEVVERRERASAERESPARVYLAAENRLLLDAVSRMLAKRHGVEVTGTASASSFDPEVLRAQQVDIL